MNYYTEIIKHIDFYLKHSHGDVESGNYQILSHLIKIIGEKHFNEIFTHSFINRDDITFDEMFVDFHKSMRQTDFFDECYRKIKKEGSFEDKRSFEYERIGGHLDMIFHGLIHASNEPYRIFKSFYEEINDIDI